MLTARAEGQLQSDGRSRLVSLAARVWAVLCGLYFLWEGFTYNGLFGRLAEFQINRFGAYAPLLTYLFLFCLLVVPVWLIVRLFARRGEKKLEMAELFALRISQARQLRIVLVALGLTSLAVTIGIVTYATMILPNQSGKLQTIAVSELGTVAFDEGPARLVGGELGTIIFFGQDWFIGDDRTAFSPYRAVSATSGPAQVFVQLKVTGEKDAEAIVQRPAWTGLIVEGGLPGPARVLFNSIGVGIPTPHYTLYENEYSLKIRYWLQSIQWLILAAFFGIMVALQTRTIRRLENRKMDETG